MALTCVTARADVMQTGQYALPQGKALIVSRLSLSKNRELAVTQFMPASKHPILACASHPQSAARPCYEFSEGGVIHVILVRDDFGAFSHVHPQQKGGAYSIHVSLEPKHRYYAYVASTVRGMPEQVFRFVLQSAPRPSHITATTIKPSTQTTVGPYVVSLDQPALRAGKPQVLNADIVRKPRSPGIAPFHVASVQAILVNTSTLSFGHVDGASDQGVCCEYALRMPALSKGLYKLWLQFDDGTAIFTAPFTFAAR